MMMTQEQFESLEPFDRGYVVYLYGRRDDEPNIPNEEEPPYELGSIEYTQYLSGKRQAISATG